jgi:hypothetical protein
MIELFRKMVRGPYQLPLPIGRSSRQSTTQWIPTRYQARLVSCLAGTSRPKKSQNLKDFMGDENESTRNERQLDLPLGRTSPGDSLEGKARPERSGDGEVGAREETRWVRSTKEIDDDEKWRRYLAFEIERIKRSHGVGVSGTWVPSGPAADVARGERYRELAKQISETVIQKQAAYGDSFGRSGRVMEELFPDGIATAQMHDALTIVRILDKLFRIATDRDALGESPYKDIMGYALLATERIERQRAKLDSAPAR